MYRIFFVFLFVINVAAGVWSSEAGASVLVPCGAMKQVDFWVANNPMGETVILDGQKIKKLQRQMYATPTGLVELGAYPQKIRSKRIYPALTDYSVLQGDVYCSGRLADAGYKQELQAETDAENLPKYLRPQYAVTVEHTDVRTLPESRGLFNSPEDREFDLLQETTLEVGEPVLILHRSRSGSFCYIQACNYTGWVETTHLAVTERETWLDFLRPENFLVTTGARTYLPVGEKQLFCSLGTRLPWESREGTGYWLQLPTRDGAGNLAVKRYLLSDAQGWHDGYLPYTENNVVRLAWKFLDLPYGWGGLNESQDCSGLVYAVYRTMGICLPRNADMQMLTAGQHKILEGKKYWQRLHTLNSLPTGSGVYMDGHCGIYIGSVEGRPYVIHALGSYKRNGVKQRVMQVVVSDFEWMLKSGNCFMERLLQAVSYR